MAFARQLSQPPAALSLRGGCCYRLPLQPDFFDRADYRPDHRTSVSRSLTSAFLDLAALQSWMWSETLARHRQAVSPHLVCLSCADIRDLLRLWMGRRPQPLQNSFEVFYAANPTCAPTWRLGGCGGCGFLMASSGATFAWAPVVFARPARSTPRHGWCSGGTRA